MEGERAEPITGIAALDEATNVDLAFLGNPKYRRLVSECAAGVILLPEDYEGHPRVGQAYLRVRQPSAALAVVCRHIEEAGKAPLVPGIHPTAIVNEGAFVDPGAHIGPQCVVEQGVKIGPGVHLVAQVFVGRGAQIGEGCVLHPRVTLYAGSVLGARVTLHAGAVVGSDGFGYETVHGIHEKVPHIGRVVIEDDVEIGANTTIDRGRFAETRIGRGAKIDNLVQVAHNVHIGPGCLIASQAGISGSTTLGQYVMIGGQAGLAGHIKLADQAIIGAQAGVSKDVPPKAFLSDTPAWPIKEARRAEVYRRRLPELFQRVSGLEKASLANSSPEESEQDADR